jgi:hypothetical protein
MGQKMSPTPQLCHLLADVRGVQTVRWYGKISAVELNRSKDMLWPSADNFPGVDGMLGLQITTLSAVRGYINFWAANKTLRSL